jgi:nitroimidazol reductase NimA-like FMN-containing flavoprotein (pyridoxamine 5'-phosphate oxidase superfamily)
MSGDPAATARQIIERVTYMTLATADENGRPWASPVWFAHSPDFDEFFWVSRHEALHSLNIAARPQVSLAIFDSHAVPGEGQAVYVAASASMLSEGDDLNAGIEIFSKRSVAQGIGPWTPEHVAADRAIRLYRAAAVEHWILDKDNPAPGDHRMSVRP